MNTQYQLAQNTYKEALTRARGIQNARYQRQALALAHEIGAMAEEIGAGATPDAVAAKLRDINCNVLTIMDCEDCDNARIAV